MQLPSVTELWPRLRYERLFPLARFGMRAAKLCAVLAGTVEYLIDPVRREVASRRIARALALPEKRAREIFRASLICEALEEAEIVFLMAHPGALARIFPAGDDEPSHVGGTIYVTLHLGRPILAYLHLAWWRHLDVTIMGRALSADNPMPDAKRRYGRRRIAWIESLSRPFLDNDAASVARARQLLLDGRSLFAAIDLPGYVVARAAEIDVFGERTHLASGIITLARLCGAPLQPVVAVNRPQGLALYWGRRIEPRNDASTAAEVFRELLTFVRMFPEEWWMWPYLVAAANGTTRPLNAGAPG